MKDLRTRFEEETGLKSKPSFPHEDMEYIEWLESRQIDAEKLAGEIHMNLISCGSINGMTHKVVKNDELQVIETTIQNHINKKPYNEPSVSKNQDNETQERKGVEDEARDYIVKNGCMSHVMDDNLPTIDLDKMAKYLTNFAQSEKR